MEENKKDACSRIELRSEKVRKLVGSIPATLVRWGMVWMIVVSVLLVAVLVLVPYPYGGGETILEHLFAGVSP